MEQLIEAIDELTQVIINSQSTNYSDWAMVIITFIYVVATILICVFNFRSASATTSQVKEQKRQFDETNCPCVDVTLEMIRSGLICLKVHNTGQKMAYNVNVKINDDFINQITNTEDRERIKRFSQSTYHLGSGQKWFMFLCSHLELKSLDKIPLTLNISYQHNGMNIENSTTIDLSQYYWMLIYDSPIEDIRGYMKKISETSKKDFDKKQAIYSEGREFLYKLNNPDDSENQENNAEEFE